MPIYEYKCMSCGQINEIYVPSARHLPEPVCSSCQSKNLKKILSTPSVVRLGNETKKGLTCCGSTERCETPPCSTGSACRRE
ncbi:MAG: zinc ribbon domain-containing protein [Candidatus Aminicenantes bacterium]|nr:zinc ribbon domain-containing protein [Candidatus Aminicenantes bacterium]